MADFGLARARRELLQDTPTAADPQENGLSEGATHMAPTGGYTPAYCSEEQYLGEKLTRRTDIYSWAVSVLEMYLGKRPWKKSPSTGLPTTLP